MGRAMTIWPELLAAGVSGEPHTIREGLGGVAIADGRGAGAAGGRQTRRLPTGQAASSAAAAGEKAAQAQDAAAPGADAAQGAVRIGVISDNHGYLDPAVLTVFAGVTHIIHAGDIMDPAILAALQTIAPVTAVCGNLDAGELVEELPREAAGEIAGVRFLVGHKPKRLLNRLSAGKIEGERPDLVVWGHTHVPSAAWVDGALYLNPGTASSPDEEDDGPTVAIVEVEPAGLSVKFVPLERKAAAAQIDREARAARGR
jgi:uncharacterized protein